MKNTKISIPASIHLSGQPFIGIYNAKKTLPLKSKSGCDDCHLDERFNELKDEIASLSDVYDPKGAASAYETLIEHKIGEAVLATIRSANQYAYDLVGLSAGALCSDLSGLSNFVINETIKIETKINEIISSLSSLSDQIDIIPVIDPTDPSEEDQVAPPPGYSIQEIIWRLTNFMWADGDFNNPEYSSEVFIKGLSYNPVFQHFLNNIILETIANNYAEISSGAYVSAVYASKEELSNVRDELLEMIDSRPDSDDSGRISALEEEIEKLKKERNSLILETWDPFALSDITDTRGSLPHTRDFLSNYVVDLCSDFTMGDMEGSFYGIHGMLNGCYFSVSGKEYIPSIPYEEEVTATYEVSTYVLTTQNIINEQGYSSYDYGIGNLWNYPVGSTVDISEKSNPLSNGSTSSGVDGMMWHDNPPPDSQCWALRSTHIIEETASAGPTFNHLRKTYNAIVSAFLNDDDNFEILFDEHNVKMLDQEETTMDILQGAMNNLIYTLSGVHNAHTDILYQGALPAFVSDENYTLDSVAAALKNVITILQTK